MGKKVCAVLSCKNASGVKNVSFYDAMKRPPEVQPAWKAFCGETEPTERRVFICSDHFSKADFINISLPSKGVKKFAVPVLNVPVHQSPVFHDNDIAVGANEVIEQKSFDEMKECLKNMKQRRETCQGERIPRDHDYCFSTKRFEKSCVVIQNLRLKNKRLQTTVRKQGRIIKRKNKSICLWKKKFKNLKQSIASKKKEMAGGILSEFIRNSSRPSKGERYSLETKNLALCLYYCSTRTYREIRQHLKLPSPGLIKKWIRTLKINEGICQSILQLLKEKAKTLSKKDRVVCISIDEMSLKPNLSYFAKAKPDIIVGFPSKLPGQTTINTKARSSSACVVMIRFVGSGYFFSNEGFKTNDLITIVEAVASSIIETGLIPKVIVCDQNATNRSLFTKLGITNEKPYFFLREEKIYGMFDAPHLLKSSRNNLMRHNAIYNGKIAKWEHIRMLYDEDSVRLPRSAPKLGIGHIYLPAFGEMRVGVAAETLSQTVASSINMYVASGVLPEECEATAGFCSDIDQLFDAFNSFYGNGKGNKELLNPLQQDSAYWKILEEMKLKLQDLTFVDNKCENIQDISKHKKLPKQSRKPWFITGWLLNIESVKQLFNELKEEFNFDSLSTRVLNQDCLENFFGIVRMRNMANNRPDPAQFMAAYRAASVSQMLKKPDKSNCEQDNGLNLFNLKDFVSSNILEKEVTSQAEEISTNQSDDFDLAQINCISYTAGWITRSIIHEECLKKINGDHRTNADHSILNLNRSYSAVSQRLESFLKEIACAFKENFKAMLSKSNVGIKKKLSEFILQQNSSELLCESCKRLVCDKYINMLMKGELKVLNNNLKKTRSRKRIKTTQTEKARKLNIV